MTEKLKPMDIYATNVHLVSFDIAAYCRGHKFSPQAVNLARALREWESARDAVVAAEARMEAAEENIATLAGLVREKMEADSHA